MQARNQLGAPGGAKSFPRGAQIFELYPTHFSRKGKKFSRGGFALPGYRPDPMRNIPCDGM